MFVSLKKLTSSCCVGRKNWSATQELFYKVPAKLHFKEQQNDNKISMSQHYPESYNTIHTAGYLLCLVAGAKKKKTVRAAEQCLSSRLRCWMSWGVGLASRNCSEWVSFFFFLTKAPPEADHLKLLRVIFPPCRRKNLFLRTEIESMPEKKNNNFKTRILEIFSSCGPSMFAETYKDLKVKRKTFKAKL